MVLGRPCDPLEGQVLAAWRAQMGADPAKVAAVINAVPGYAAIPGGVGRRGHARDHRQDAGRLLPQFVSDNSPWDRYEAGDKAAVSAAAIAGQEVFAGKGRCTACHAPPFYGNSTFFNIGLEDGKAKPDPAANVTKDEADRGAFKTPSLRSVELSAPYFHDGSATR